MNILELGAIGELVGGVAVIGSLIYVGLQIRQNNRATSSSRHQEMLHYIQETYKPFVQSKDIAELIRSGRDSPDDLDETDWERFLMHALDPFAMWDAAYISWRSGLLDQQLWSTWDKGARSLWCGPGYQRAWNQGRDTLSPAFQSYVDENIFSPDGA